jgi:FKBP-type peptidyl-prolyl cis-trans isomerase 2
MHAKNGDTVKVHYTLKLDNGEVVESTTDTLPVQLTLGKEQMIPGFENSIIGMKSKEFKTITIPIDEAYGMRDEKKVFELNREKIPEAFEPQIGQLVRISRPNGKAFLATVLNTSANGFIMDANHPLAGKNLTFDLELIEILNT